MTPEQLLIPRYEVNEHGYPDMIFEPNQIISLNRIDKDGNPYWRLRKGANWFKPFFNKFPNIFKPLQWWERREEKDLPQFVIWNYQKGDDMQMKFHVAKVTGWSQGNFRVHAERTITTSDCWLPATEEQYNNYINSKK
jgi:hypothetical protein